jgi:hypothetical protein
MKKSKNGSVLWRTTRRLETLTTAGAERLTTGAKDIFIAAASVGRRRTGDGRPGAGWAWLREAGSEQAVSKATTGITTARDKRMGKRSPMDSITA